MRTFLSLVCLLVVVSSCSIKSEEFQVHNGYKVSLNRLLENKKGGVIYFISPVCPLCQNYAERFRQLSEQGESLFVVGVVSGNYHSEKELETYVRDYEIDFPVILDPEFSLANHFEATTTPEALLVDSLGEKQYQGAIDNWAIDLGRKRLKATEWYLNDAIALYLNGKEIETKYTKPVGCYIE